jgi:acyl-CoA thioesterase FadM
MKFRVALVTVIVAGLTASLAVAAPAKSPKKPAGTDTTATTTTTAGNAKQRICRPRFAQILRGTLVSVADDQLSFTFTVTQTNRHARLYRGQTVTIQVNANTRIWRLGQKVTLGELTVGDRLVVQTRFCKYGADATAPLLAARVTARPAPAERICRPRFALVMEGTLGSVAGDQLSFSITVKHSNKHARLYRGQTITVQVDANTRIWRLGQKVTLGELTVGDRLVVQTRACKKGTDLTAPLLAARVTARPAKPAPTTTTTTTTTT